MGIIRIFLFIIFGIMLLEDGNIPKVNAICEGYCKLKPNPGPCRGAFPYWHFNKTASECTKFIYGGCGGNRNNFEKKEECVEKCGDCGSGQ